MKIRVFVFIVSEATRICQEWVVVQFFPGTVLVLCDSRTVLCSISTLFFSVLRHTTRLVLVVVQILVDIACKNAVSFRLPFIISS